MQADLAKLRQQPPAFLLSRVYLCWHEPRVKPRARPIPRRDRDVLSRHLHSGVARGGAGRHGKCCLKCMNMLITRLDFL